MLCVLMLHGFIIAHIILSMVFSCNDMNRAGCASSFILGKLVYRVN